MNILLINDHDIDELLYFVLNPNIFFFIDLSSLHENKYGWCLLIANFFTWLTCPVNVNFNIPVGNSQIFYCTICW